MYRPLRLRNRFFTRIPAAACILLVVLGCGDSAVGPVMESDPPQPARLVFLTQPRDASAGEAINPAVRVAVLDSAGNLVPDAALAMTVTLDDNPGGTTLDGDRTVVSAAGIAEFDALSLETAATGYTVAVSATGLSGATSDAFDISPAAATRLVIVNQPDTVEGLVSFATPIDVAVHDEFGNVVPDAATTVIMALAVNPSGRTDMSEIDGLSGTTLDVTVDGVAVFSDLRIGLPGSGWVVEASADGLEPALSEEITVRLTFDRVMPGFSHACGITVAGFAYCWGRGEGRVGDGALADRLIPTPVASGRRFDDLTVGSDHACAREADSSDMYCWGHNGSGQLGTNSGQGVHPEPTLVAGGHQFIRASAGRAHTCAITTSGSAYCWGSNIDGRLGNGTTFGNHIPALVSGVGDFRQVSAGAIHTCGVTTDNVAYCWGRNSVGEVGDGTTQDRHVPTPVAGSLSFARVVAGGAFSCGVDTDGAAWCWGTNDGGRVGDGSAALVRTSPVAVAGGLTFGRVESVELHSCGLTAGGTAWCWGINDWGGLGDGTTQDRHQPTPVSGGLSFAHLSLGTGLTCGVTADGNAYCWGRNSHGQVGDGTTADRLSPTRVVH